MTKSELESKHLSELHALAAEADLPRYRMLRREELIEKLAGGESSAEKPREPREGREPRPRRRRGRDGERGERGPQRAERSGSRQRPQRKERPQPAKPEPKAEEPKREPEPARQEESAEAGPSRPRRRRRRRFGRKSKGLRLHDLLTSAVPGRQTIVYAETREGCTTLLREIAAGLTGESNGPDPVAVLVEPGPEELAEWRRAAPEAEIVAAAQARHAEDAFAQAARRAESGESVIVLVDSLTRLAEDFEDADLAKSLLDGSAGVTVVAGLERK